MSFKSALVYTILNKTNLPGEASSASSSDAIIVIYCTRCLIKTLNLIITLTKKIFRSQNAKN